MALDAMVKVALPPHSVKVQSTNGISVQHTIRAYRNEKGKPARGKEIRQKILNQANVWKMREYFCISLFSYCTIGAKDPLKPAAPT